jgi:hypothetical protein
MVEKLKRLNYDCVRVLNGKNSIEIQNKYEKLVNLINDYGGRVHGSQFHTAAFDDTVWDIIAVYFNVPKESLEQFKAEFDA